MVEKGRNFAVNAVQFVPIKPHLLRTSSGTGGLNLAELNTALTQINTYYLNVGSGLQFYFCGSPNYINNSTYYDFDNSEENTLCSSNDVLNAINVYFTNTITFGSLQVSGYAYFPSSTATSNRVFIQASSATDNRTLIHELGHYFNLLHTFQGSTGLISQRERVNGSNCTTAGDLLCDTPADPFGRDSVSLLGCTYTGTALDPNGQLYNPSLSNIMSYYPINCGSTFTSGQYNRMNEGFLLRIDPSNAYTLNCGSTVTSTNIPSGLTGILTASGVQLTFSDNSTNETGFLIERSTTSATAGFVPLAGLPPNTTTYTDGTTTAFTTYYYRVKASNSTSEYSNVFMISTALNYCLPSYDAPCTTIEVVIDDFLLKQGSTTIISNLNSNCSTGSYGNFTTTTYNVTAGSTYTLTARAVNNGSGTYFDQHVTAWIDYDKDGLFESSEIVYQSSSTVPRMNPTASGNFTIPSNASSGITRLRIRSRFASLGQVTDPCINYEYGEAEDYQLNIVNTAPPTITTETVAPNPICAGNNISVSFTTANFSSSSYVVQLSDATGNNFSNISTTGNASPLTATIPINTPLGSGYKVRVVSLSPSVTGSASTAFVINAKPAVPTVSSPVSYCQFQTATSLSATGSNLLWYNSATGGTGSSTAPTPSTSSAGTTYYYVSQTVSNCESDRATIQVDVMAKPAVPTVSSPVNYVQNQSASPLSATGSNLLWYNSATGGTGSSTAPTPNTASIGTTYYYVSQTVNNCESERAMIQVDVNAPNMVTACPNIKVYLEGALNGNTMTTILNQKQLLPGQIPPDPSKATPAGQPYKIAPWYYNGTETTTSYSNNAVDWILISVRTSPTDTTTKVYETAAVLLNDGTTVLYKTCPSLNASNSYYITVEHRNHLGAMSHQPVQISNNQLTYDFSLQQSYIPSGNPASGQILVGTKYCLLAGDAQKQLISEINAQDNSRWRLHNGTFNLYHSTDYNLDSEVNAIDNSIWRRNNGKFSTLIY